jgi:hypothetical protein
MSNDKPEAPAVRLQDGHTNVRLEPWMRGALKARAEALQQAVIAEAEKQGLPADAVAPITASSAHRDALRAELQRGEPNLAYLTGFAEGCIAAFATTRKQVGQALAGIRAGNKKE